MAMRTRDESNGRRNPRIASATTTTKASSRITTINITRIPTSFFISITIMLVLAGRSVVSCWRPSSLTSPSSSLMSRGLSSRRLVIRAQTTTHHHTTRRPMMPSSSSSSSSCYSSPSSAATAGSRRRRRHSLSSSFRRQRGQPAVRIACLSLAAVAVATTVDPVNGTSPSPSSSSPLPSPPSPFNTILPGTERTSCAPADPAVAAANTGTSSDHLSSSYFPEEALQYDHYNGVIINLERIVENNNEFDFGKTLALQLQEWKDQGRRGIWLHVPPAASDKIHAAMELGFDYHMVVDRKMLILTKWLDEETTSRLPHGPTHQVGVGCLVFHPRDTNKMLVVQEKTGPAAAYGLWKMPTGLTDPGEDIPLAAVRELQEETGLNAQFEGILTFRQAHATDRGSVLRANSDLFFVCVMKLSMDNVDDADDEDSLFRACPDEIAAIRWMSVDEYCNQERWQSSPMYSSMNAAIRDASKHAIIGAHILPLRFPSPHHDDSVATNALYKSIINNNDMKETESNNGDGDRTSQQAKL